MLLKQAKGVYYAYSHIEDNEQREVLWDLMWDLLKKYFNCDYGKICYVIDLFMIANMVKSGSDVKHLIHMVHSTRL